MQRLYSLLLGSRQFLRLRFASVAMPNSIVEAGLKPAWGREATYLTPANVLPPT